MNLYDLANKYVELLDYLQSVDTTDPEQNGVYQETLNALDGAIEDKAEGIVHVLNQLRYNEETLDKEIKRLREKKQALANNQRNLKDYLKDTMEYAGKERIKTPLFSIWTQNNRPSVIVEDQDKLPKEYIRERTTVTVDKQELSKALQDNEVEGARLEYTKGVRFK